MLCLFVSFVPCLATSAPDRSILVRRRHREKSSRTNLGDSHPKGPKPRSGLEKKKTPSALENDDRKLKNSALVSRFVFFSGRAPRFQRISRLPQPVFDAILRYDFEEWCGMPENLDLDLIPESAFI